MGKPIVALFSDSNFLALNLLENFLFKNCRVLIFSSDKKNWLIKTQHIINKSNFKILDEIYFLNFGVFNYVIFNSSLEKFKKFYRFDAIKKNKTLAIFPIEYFDAARNSEIYTNSNLALVYVGDLLGARIDFDEKILVQKIIQDSIKKAEMVLPVGEVFYPIFVSDAAREIVRWTLSFGPYGKEIFLIGSQTSGNVFWRGIVKYLPNTKLYYDNTRQLRVLPRGCETRIVQSNLVFILGETFRWIFRGKTSLKKIKPAKIRTRMSKKIKLLLISILFTIFFPFISILINMGLFYFSFKSFASGNNDRARNVFLISKTPALLAREESRILSYVPILGKIYKESYFVLNLVYHTSDIAIQGIYMSEASGNLFTRVLGNEMYDAEKYSSEIKLSLEYIYQSFLLIDADVKNQTSQGVFLARKIGNRLDFERIKKMIYESAKIANSLPSILGKNERRSYLLLFQNNMEIRPTGGFIGSFGIVTFDEGRMADFVVSDVYSADGQLKGHVEPPEPIRRYLGEANWYLRDANWDPDFPVTAKRVEWFLDKEIDRRVDGVISIDLTPIKDLLKIIGPIYLADYDMDITSENLYEKTQGEVQEEFFPGTHKKASFLTALSRNLVMELSQIPSGQKMRIFWSFLQNLETRHIQIYLHNEDVERSIGLLNWGGEVAEITCGATCFADMVGVVEANVGVNKANYFVTRNHELKVDILPDSVKREMTFEIINSANPGLGQAGKYKAYVRILVPENSKIEGGLDVYEAGGRKEIGFLAEVLAGTRKKYVISWSSPSASKIDYKLYIRKQAGTSDDDKFSVVINGNLIYNSGFRKDIWLQKP